MGQTFSEPQGVMSRAEDQRSSTFNVLMLFSYLFLPTLVQCVLGAECSPKCIIFTNSITQQSHEVVIIYPHFTEKEYEAGRKGRRGEEKRGALCR